MKKRLVNMSVCLTLVVGALLMEPALGQAVPISKPAKPAKPAEAATMADQEVEMVNNIVTFNAGAILLNPYRIGVSNVLERADSKSSFFLEFALNNVWAWNPERRQRFDAVQSDDWICAQGGRRFRERVDLQARLAFYLRGGQPTNEVASALVGSGDFAGEVTLGLNLFQHVSMNTSQGDHYDKTTSAQSFGVIGSYSATTDTGAFDIHDRVFCGLGYRAAFKPPIAVSGAAKKREALFSTQLGAAWTENVQFVDTTSRVIRMTQGDLPKYSMKPCMALETEVYYPLGLDSSLVLGTRLYAIQPDDRPNQWSAYIAFTYSLEKLKKLMPGSN